MRALCKASASEIGLRDREYNPSAQWANAFIAVVKDPAEGENIAVSVSGSVQWRDANGLAVGSQIFIGAGINVNVYVSQN